MTPDEARAAPDALERNGYVEAAAFTRKPGVMTMLLGGIGGKGRISDRKSRMMAMLLNPKPGVSDGILDWGDGLANSFGNFNINSCHPASATLELADGVSIRINEAQVGDKIRAPGSGHDDIIGIFHAESDTHGHYLRLTVAGGASMEISPGHHLFANDEEIDSADVVLGDMLDTTHGREPVTHIEAVERRGAYHILTRGGAYYVDGALASDYVGAIVPRPIAELARLYAVARYELGVPGVPIGRERLVSNRWVSDLLGGMGVPRYVLPLLFPLTLPVALLTELANTAAEHLDVTTLGAGTILLLAFAKKTKKEKAA